MSKFKVGDKVIIVQPYQGMDLIGAKATILCIDGGFYGLEIPGWEGGHSLGGRIDSQKGGWWVMEKYIKPAKVFRGNHAS